MDSGSTTGHPGYQVGESRASVSSYVTSIVLLVGVLGGLIIVVTVILVCKYCHGKGKPLRGRNYSGSGRDNLSERTFRALQRYETINSDVFSDPSTCSIDGIPTTPRKAAEIRFPDHVDNPEGATETTHLKSDFDKDDYTDQGDPYPQDFPQAETAFAGNTSTPPQAGQNGGTGGSGSRRVSFQLDNLPRSCSSGDFKVRRYIEGDFHHLKHSKIGRPLPRQFSMGGAGSAIPGRMLLDDHHFRFSSLDERLTSLGHGAHGAGNDQQRHMRDLHQLAQQQQILQQQQQILRDTRRTSTEREVSPRQSRDSFLSHELMRSSREKRESPSPTYISTKALKNSPSPTFGIVRDSSNKQSPSPPIRLLRESSPNSSSLACARDSVAADSPPSPFRPIKDFNNGSSPSPPYKPVRTQVSVEIHQHHPKNKDGGNQSGNSSEDQNQQLMSRLDRARSLMEPSASPFKTVPLARTKAQHRRIYSHSLESASPARQSSYRDTRKVKSHDDFLEDYDVLKITEFSKGPFYNTDFDIISELGSPTGGKVRYNDTGSLEQLNEEQNDFAFGLDSDEVTMVEDRRDQEHAEDTEDSVETLNGNRKYRALWRLRATLEEEEECSDTIRMEDTTSPDESPDREHCTPNTTSFESNAQSDPCPSDHRDSGIQFESCSSSKPANQANFLHPNYENRRQNYRNALNNRLQRGNQSTSVENSFDSVETDGEISDTSRYEVTTTSFESTTTTDNTDSTTESQASKLRQMKADSGYRSLETQHQTSKEFDSFRRDSRASVDCGEGISSRRDSRASVERAEGLLLSRDVKVYADREVISSVSTSAGASALAAEAGPSSHHRERCNSGSSLAQKNGSLKKSSPTTSHFDRRNGKTASKKRREYSRERQTVQVYESINEPETDSRSDLHSGDSFEDSSIPHKISVFARFFKSHPRGHRAQYLVRDYSIDEKTNSIFNEFVRQEIPQSARESTGNGRLGVRRSPRMHRHRLQRKHTEPALLSEERAIRRDRLAPGMRSASLGSDSSASSARRISPQDSIEEEDDEARGTILSSHRVTRWSRPSAKSSDLSFVQSQFHSVAIHDIPIIKLPEEETQDAS